MAKLRREERNRRAASLASAIAEAFQLAAHRALEALDDPSLHVVASAPVVGAFDLAGMVDVLQSYGTAKVHSSPRLAVLNNQRYNDYNHSHTAFFYLFECAEDHSAARGLFEAAFAWARGRGLDRIDERSLRLRPRLPDTRRRQLPGLPQAAPAGQPPLLAGHRRLG